MTYTWKEFNYDEALNGALVGVPTTAPQTGQTIDEVIDDISKVAGTITKTNKYEGMMIVFNGKTVFINEEGKVIASTPSGAYAADTQMYIATATIQETVGTTIERTRQAETGYSQNVAVTTMEARDSFAIQILSAMLVHAGNPEQFDDARITMFASAAYRWAQAMMAEAANARLGDSTTPSGSTTVDVNSADLQSNLERLLFNMSEYMKNGVTMIGPTPANQATPNPVIVAVRDLEYVTEAYHIPKITGGINVNASISDSKFIRLEFATNMAYSEISILLQLAVLEGTTPATRKFSHIIPRGSVVLLIDTDEDVTSITSITSITVRGKGGNDQNTYNIVLPQNE